MLDMLYTNPNFVSTDAQLYLHTCTCTAAAATLCALHMLAQPHSTTLKHSQTHAKQPNHACCNRIHVFPLPPATHNTPTTPWNSPVSPKMGVNMMLVFHLQD